MKRASSRMAARAGHPITWLIWLPCLVFEIALALWLLIKGVNSPAPQILEASRTVGWRQKA